MAVGTFENLIAWQRARTLAKHIYEATRKGSWVRDYGLAGQIQRAAVSVMSNIAEGNERGAPAEFHHFLCIAKASCAEVKSLLYVALDVGHIDEEAFCDLVSVTDEVSRLVGGLRSSVARMKAKPTPN